MKSAWPLLLALTAAAIAQERPAVDRTDPKAVAEAYITACRAGDVEGALALLVNDEKITKPLRQILKFATEFASDREPGVSFADSFRESLCLPFAGTLPMTHALKDAAVEGDRAQLSFEIALATEQKLVLRRAADGTWGVDIMESAKATAGGKGTYITEMLEGLSSIDQGEGASLAAGESSDVLYRLDQALAEYAQEHDGCLPPAEKWVDEIELYVLDRTAFKSPGAPDLAYGFAMNVAAGGRKYVVEDEMAEEGEEFLVLFEWPGGERNATATPEQLAQTTSFWPDGSVALLTSRGAIDVLPKGMTLEQKRAADAQAMQPDMPAADDPGMHLYQCAANLRVLAAAARKYAREHGGLLPLAESWQDDLAPYILIVRDEGWWGEEGEQDPLHCPAAADIEFGYAINVAVAGKNALDLTDQGSLVLFFESNLNTPNAAGNPERDKCDPPRHQAPWAEGEDAGLNQVAYLTGDTGYYGKPEFEGGIFGDE
ncbi:MAG: hypothetical protein FJX75_23120 [Armatimonadetes bacterium]|nr:hypothetical protein [Armatimonadota bacterium]